MVEQHGEVFIATPLGRATAASGFGRQRAMALLTGGFGTLQDIVNSTKEKLLGILRSEKRVTSLINAISNAIGFGADRLAKVHGRVAKEIGVADLVEACNTALGRDYELAVASLLAKETSWKVTALDDGRRQNVPDIQLEFGDKALLIVSVRPSTPL